MVLQILSQTFSPPKPSNKPTRRDKGKEVAEPSSEKKSPGLTNIRTWLQATQPSLNITTISNQAKEEPISLAKQPTPKPPQFDMTQLSKEEAL